MSDDKHIKSEEELNSVDGGRISPTWVPVDESCPVCNQTDECPFQSRKGRYDNCHECKLFD